MKIRLSDDAVAIACGADLVAAELESAGAAVQRVSSWGLHWLEPLVEIEGQGYGPVRPDEVKALLDGKLQSKCIGAISEHPFLMRQNRLTFARAGKTRPLSKQDYALTNGWVGLRNARALAPSDVVDMVLASGLRGRGGAGFPTGIKWRSVLECESDQKYIVCNADEGDSGTFADRMAMEGDPFQLLEGMAIAGHATRANKGYIYIRSEYPHAISKLNQAIELCRDVISPFQVEVRVGAGSYVCGEETALLNSLEGRRGEVRVKPPLPAHQGLFGKPTVVNNVLTLCAVPYILCQGPDSYHDFGMGKSRGTFPIQLSGNIKHAGLFEAGFGITLKELVYDIGGGTASGRPVRAVQVGGPLGAYFPTSMFDLPIDYESFDQAGGLIGHGGVVVFDDSVDMAIQARFAFEFCEIESCGKCTPCRIGSIRGKETIEDIIAARNVDANLSLIEDLCDTMTYGSLCAMGGFTPYPVQSAIKYFSEDFRSRGDTRPRTTLIGGPS